MYIPHPITIMVVEVVEGSVADDERHMCATQVVAAVEEVKGDT